MMPGLASYGGYKPESPESRALRTFSSDKFDYRDQGKNLIQLNNAVGYMSGMMRKMQSGIDKANQNYIQQLQSLITDLIVMFGGGGDTGLDWGDLKYVIQGIGALFGFADENGNLTVPINLFNAGWHFFANYIGITTNFRELIDQLIDAAIATVLDLFGNVPVVGQALQQFAAIVSEIRDLLDPVAEAWQAFLDVFSLDLGNIEGIDSFFGPLAPIWDALKQALDGIHLPDFVPMFRAIAGWSHPFVDLLVQVINAFAPLVETFIDIGSGVLTSAVELLLPVIEAIAPIMDMVGPVIDTLQPILDEITAVINGLSGVMQVFTGNGDLGGLLDVFTGFLTFQSPLNALNIVGQFLPSVFGNVPIGALSNEMPNLLPHGMFPPGSIAPGDGWSVDTAKTATADSTGSAKHVCDGRNHYVRSTPISIAAGKTLNISTKLWWQGFTGTGSPIRVDIVKFKGNTELDKETLVTSAASGTSSAWTTLNTSYTSPADGSVDNIKIRLVLMNTATAGTVWYDDVTVKQPGEIQQSWIKDLVPGLDGILSMFGLSNWLDLFDLDAFGAWGNILSGALNFLEPMWNKFYDIFGGVLGSAGKTLSTVFTIGKSFFDILASGTGANFGQLTTRFTEILQLGQALAGTAVTPITSLITSVLNRIQYIGTSGIFNATGIPTLAQSKISNLGTDLAARVLISGAQGFATFAEGIARFFTGNNWTWGSTFDSNSIASWGINLITILSQSNDNYTNLNTTHVEHLQTKQILAKQSVTPINGLIQSIYNFWF